MVNAVLNSKIPFALISLNFKTEKNMKMQSKKEFTTKYRMFGAINLRQPIKFLHNRWL